MSLLIANILPNIWAKMLSSMGTIFVKFSLSPRPGLLHFVWAIPKVSEMMANMILPSTFSI